jgi:hypothetical protein
MMIRRLRREASTKRREANTTKREDDKASTTYLDLSGQNSSSTVQIRRYTSASASQQAKGNYYRHVRSINKQESIRKSLKMQGIAPQ